MICPHTTCKWHGLKDRHHKYWPRTWYKTPLERDFRGDPRNITVICRCAHDLEHLKKPPKKPSIAEMKRFLGRK
jgi:hypothetical protein